MLEGLKVVELATHIAAPAASGVLADWGADVVKIEWGAILRLVRESDVFITNRRPAALESARLDWDSLKLENPRLIYSSVTGYGLTGPDADLPGYDVAAFWSRAGVASVLIPKGQEPFVLRTGIGDHTRSLATVSGILAALVRRGAARRERAPWSRPR